MLGDERNEPLNPTGYIHADGPNGSEKLVMAGLPKHPIFSEYPAPNPQTSYSTSTYSRDYTPKRFTQNGE